MFRKGDIVVCNNKMDNDLPSSISDGHQYEVIDDERQNMVYIKNDKGHSHTYSSRRFISLLEDRLLKIKKICSKLEM